MKTLLLVIFQSHHNGHHHDILLTAPVMTATFTCNFHSRKQLRNS